MKSFLCWRTMVLSVACSLIVAGRSATAFTCLLTTRYGRSVSKSLPQSSILSFSSSIQMSTQVTPDESSSSSSSTPPTEKTETAPPPPPAEEVPLYRSEGIFAVSKPLDWTSNDVVSYIRGILEREARNRGAKPGRVGGSRRRRGRKSKKNVIKVGHGGTLDPLATGVLVIGVGKGTKEMQG